MTLRPTRRPRHPRRLAAAASCLLLAALGTAAHAQSQENEAAAEALFRQGVEKLNSGKTDEACPLLEASQRRGPSVGTLLYLGECYARTSRAASSWASFREAARMARTQKDEKREKIATGRAADLEKEVSYLVVSIPPTTRVPGLQIRRDATFIEDSLWGVALPLDPGDHMIEATAPGRITSKKIVTVAPHAARAEVTIAPLELAPVIKDAPPPATSAAAPPVVSSAAPSAPPPSPPAESQPSSQTLPIGLLVGGGAGMIVGGVLLGVGVSKAHSGIDNLDRSTYDSAKGPYAAGWAVLGVGAVVAAVGGILLAKSSSEGAPAKSGLTVRVDPQIGLGSSRLSLVGSFLGGPSPIRSVRMTSVSSPTPKEDRPCRLAVASRASPTPLRFSSRWSRCLSPRPVVWAISLTYQPAPRGEPRVARVEQAKASEARRATPEVWAAETTRGTAEEEDRQARRLVLRKAARARAGPPATKVATAAKREQAAALGARRAVTPGHQGMLA